MTGRVHSSFVPKKGKPAQPGTEQSSHGESQALEGCSRCSIHTPQNALVGPRGLRKDQTKRKWAQSDLWKADNKGKLCLLRQEYVESKQKNIIFGNGTTWVDVESDEATFDRRDISNDIQ